MFMHLLPVIHSPASTNSAIDELGHTGCSYLMLRFGNVVMLFLFALPHPNSGSEFAREL